MTDKQKTKTSEPKKLSWDAVLTAVEKEDKKTLQHACKQYGGKRIKQEGVTKEEVKQQVIATAPGNAMTGRLLQDLVEKL